MLVRARNINVSILTLLKLTLAHLPFIIQEVSFFIIFAALIHRFLILSKNNEYNAMKAGGASLLRFLLPFMVMSVLFMTSIVLVLNPLIVNLLKYRNNTEKLEFNSGSTKDVVLMSKDGIIIFDHPQDNTDVKYIISVAHLEATSDKDIVLDRVSYILVDDKYSFIKRLDAKEAKLLKHKWVLKNVIERVPKKENTFMPYMDLSSNFKPQEFFNSFQQPKYIPTWKLPIFIKTLERLGIMSEKYLLYFYKLMLKPLCVLGVVCIAASFALKTQRMSRTGSIIALGTVVGIIMFFILEYFSRIIILPDIAMNFLMISLIFNLSSFVILYFSENRL